MNRMLSLRIVAAGVVLVMQIQTAKTQVPNPTIDSVMREIRQAHAALASVECDYVEKTTTKSGWIDYLKSHGDNDAGTPQSKETHVHWAYKLGKSFRREARNSVPAVTSRTTAGPSADINIFDGEKNYVIVDYGSKKSGQANISRLRRNFISPLSFGYHYNGDPIEDVLVKGKFSVSGITKDPIVGDLLKIEGDVADNGRLTLTLCPARGWMTTTVELNTPADNQKMIYNAIKMEKHDNIWIPVIGKMQLFQKTGGTESLLVETDITVSNIKLNNVADKLFAPVMASFWVNRRPLFLFVI